MHDMNNNFRYRLGYVLWDSLSNNFEINLGYSLKNSLSEGLRDSFEASIGVNFRVNGLQYSIWYNLTGIQSNDEGNDDA